MREKGKKEWKKKTKETSKETNRIRNWQNFEIVIERKHRERKTNTVKWENRKKNESGKKSTFQWLTFPHLACTVCGNVGWEKKETEKQTKRKTN